MRQYTAIGVQHFYVVDESRSSVSTYFRRTIPISVFYPAQPDPNARRLRHVDRFHPVADEALTHLLGKADLPPSVKSQIIEDAKRVSAVAQVDSEPEGRTAPYPVLINSPGSGGHRFSSLPLLETLAAEGFVVISMDHPHEGVPTVDADGRFCPEIADNPDFIEKTLQRIADTRCVLDFLERLVSEPRFAGLLDLDAIGMFGHSCGGYVATLAAAEDKRIKAMANLDGFLYAYWTPDGSSGIDRWPAMTQSQLRANPAPFLRIRGRETLDNLDALFAADARDFSGPVHFVILEGWTHGDFAVSPCFANVEKRDGGWTFFQKHSPGKAIQLANLLADFFAHYLKVGSTLQYLTAGNHIRWRPAKPVSS